MFETTDRFVPGSSVTPEGPVNTLTLGSAWHQLAARIRAFRPDVAILISRKMPRLVEVLNLDLGSPDLVLTDLAIPYSHGFLTQARVAIIDDVVNVGSTMRSAAEQARACGAREIRCFALAHRARTDVLRNETVEYAVPSPISEDEIRRFALTVPEVLSRISKPYDLDFPIVPCKIRIPYDSPLLFTQALAQAFGSSHVYDVTSPVSASAGLRRLVAHVQTPAARHAKLRFYLDSRARICNIVPIAIPSPLPSDPALDQDDRLVSLVWSCISCNGEPKVSIFEHEPFSRAALFALSLTLAKRALYDLRTVLWPTNKRLFSLSDAELVLGPNIRRMPTIEIGDFGDQSDYLHHEQPLSPSPIYPTLCDSDFRDRVRSTAGSSDPVRLFAAVFDVLAQKAGAFDERTYQLTWPYSPRDVLENPYLRLRVGPTFADLVNLFRDLGSARWSVQRSESLVTTLLDRFVDSGAVVPTVARYMGANYRIYRKGESDDRDKTSDRSLYAWGAYGRPLSLTRATKLFTILAFSRPNDLDTTVRAKDRGYVLCYSDTVLDRETEVSRYLLRTGKLARDQSQAEPTPKDRPERFRPKSNWRALPVTKEVVDYSESFSSFARSIDQCEHSEDVSLLLSTCRNIYLTANAVFVDLRRALGSDDLPAPLLDALFLLKQNNVRAARKPLERTGLLLGEAQSKLRVWKNRQSLYAEWQANVERLGALAQARVNLDLAPRERDVDPRYDPQLLAFSLEEDQSTNEKLRVLEETIEAASQLRRVASRVAPLLAALGPELDLFSSSDASSSNSSWNHLLESIDQAGLLWNATQLPSGDRELTAKALPTSQPIVLPLAANSVDSGTIEDLLSLLQTHAKRLHSSVCDAFARNAGSPPLPSPFEIDFRETHPSLKREARRFQVEIVRIGRPTQRETISIALLSCALPAGWFNETSCRFEGETCPGVARAVRQCLLDAIEAAADARVACLIAPEYFVPHDAVADLQESVRRADLLFVGGREGHFDPSGHLINEVDVLFPDGRRYFQRKQGPSVYEIRGSGYAADGLLKIFTETSLGTVAILPCSDYMEADITSAALVSSRQAVELVIVPSMNPRPEIFKHLAASDAMRLYAHVAVCNASVGETSDLAKSGTFVAAPVSSYPPFLELEPLSLSSDSIGATLYRATLSLKAIRARNRGKPEKGYLNPPHFVREFHDVPGRNA